MHVWYMAQELVAANLQAAHASASVAKAPSLAGFGIFPTGSGGNFGVACAADLESTRALAAATSKKHDTKILEAIMA